MTISYNRILRVGGGLPVQGTALPAKALDYVSKNEPTTGFYLKRTLSAIGENDRWIAIAVCEMMQFGL